MTTQIKTIEVFLTPMASSPPCLHVWELEETIASQCLAKHPRPSPFSNVSPLLKHVEPYYLVMHLLGFLHLIDQLHDVIICVVYGSKRLNIIPKMIEKVEDLFALLISF